MATYRQIIDWIRINEGFTPQTCWIADVKASHGLTSRTAPNRLDPAQKVKPCPAAKWAAIERALKHFGML